MDNEKRQILGGATISYLLIVVNALYSFIVTPFIVLQIGDASYGVYKTITAFAASLMVIDLGLGGTVQRYIANFRANEKQSLIGNFVFMSIIEAAILSLFALIVIIGIYCNIYEIFKNGLTLCEIITAKQLFIVLGVTIILHIFENVFNGVLMGYGVFIVSNGLRLFRIIVRLLGTFLLLYLWKSPLTLVLLDCGLVATLLLFEILYSTAKLNVNIAFTHFDKYIFRESFAYSIMMFITALANQMNGNLDSIAIGAFMTSTDVAVYSIAIVLFGMFEQIACSISGLLLPKVSFIVKDGLDKARDYVVSIGRIQFILIGAIYGAFVVLGKDFIMVWMGDMYIPAYYIALIIMGPAILELCLNVCLIILRATNKLKFKTFVTISMTIFNAILTIVGVKLWGYYMAAFATALSYIIGSVIVLNIYYHKEFGYNILIIYKLIFSKTLLCVVCSSLCTYIAVRCIENSIVSLAVGVVVFILVYMFSLLFYGLSDTEKRELFNIIKIKK